MVPFPASADLYLIRYTGGQCSDLVSGLVGDGQFLAAFLAAVGQHFASVGRRHPLPETVFVLSLAF